MWNWLKSLFSPPEPAGPPQTFRVFALDEGTITTDGVMAEGDSLRIDVAEAQTIRLFEMREPKVECSMITYRAEIRSENLGGRAFLEIWCCFPGRGEFFSKGLNHTVTGTTEWAWYEIPFYLKKGQQPDLIKLNLAVEGTGTVWMKNIILLKTPLAS